MFLDKRVVLKENCLAHCQAHFNIRCENDKVWRSLIYSDGRLQNLLIQIPCFQIISAGLNAHPRERWISNTLDKIPLARKRSPQYKVFVRTSPTCSFLPEAMIHKKTVPFSPCAESSRPKYQEQMRRWVSARTNISSHLHRDGVIRRNRSFFFLFPNPPQLCTSMIWRNRWTTWRCSLIKESILNQPSLWNVLMPPYSHVGFSERKLFPKGLCEHKRPRVLLGCILLASCDETPSLRVQLWVAPFRKCSID